MLMRMRSFGKQVFRLFSAANKIPKAKVKALAKAIKEVLQKAEKQILKEHPDIISGEVRDFMAIHNPGRKHIALPEVRDNTRLVGGRKTIIRRNRNYMNNTEMDIPVRKRTFNPYLPPPKQLKINNITLWHKDCAFVIFPIAICNIIISGSPGVT